MIGLVGSRSLSSPAARPLLEQLVGACARSSWPMVLSDCRGVEALALTVAASLRPAARVLCLGAADGAGWWPGAASRKLLDAVPGWGGALTYWAGGRCDCGPLCTCLRKRLIRRAVKLAHALVESAGHEERVGLIGVFSHAGSRGPAQALSAAAARGVPCVAYCLGFRPSLLPPLVPGGEWTLKSPPPGVLGVARALWLSPAGVREAKIEAWRQERGDRARDEGEQYQWRLVSPEGPAQRQTWQRRHEDHARRYLVTAESCTCRDFFYRCRPLGIACKHQLAAAAFLRRLANDEAENDARGDGGRPIDLLAA